MREVSRSSGLKSADAAISTGAGLLCAVQLITDGTNAATLVIYDNASAASGTVLYKGSITGASLSRTDVLTFPVKAVNGLYADITGTGANYIVHFG